MTTLGKLPQAKRMTTQLVASLLIDTSGKTTS